MKDTLNVTAVPGYGKVVYNEETHNHVILKLTGVELEEEKRAPISIIALLDCSSSMSPDYKIGYLRKSMVKLIDNLKAGDQLCMITYDSYVSTVFELSGMTPENKTRAISIANALSTGGCTNISGALSEAKELLKNAESLKEEGRVVRTILFSDGCATAGNTDNNVLVSMCEDLAVGQLTTMGYGKELKDPTLGMTGMDGELDVRFLQALSRIGKGNYYYMKDPDSCSRAFAYELAGLLTIAAQSITVEIEASKFFEVTEVLEDVDSDIKDGKVTITLPDVMAEEDKFVLLKGTTKKQDKVFPRTTKTPVKVTYTNPSGDKVEVIADLLLGFVKSGKEDTDIDKEVQTQIAIVEAVEAQKKAADAADAGDFNQASVFMHTAKSNLMGAGTSRGDLYASAVGDMGVAVENPINWSRGSNDYRTMGHSITRGRSSGDKILASRAQTKMASKFEDTSGPDAVYTPDAPTGDPDPDAINPGTVHVGNISFKDPSDNRKPLPPKKSKKSSTVQRF